MLARRPYYLNSSLLPIVVQMKTQIQKKTDLSPSNPPFDMSARAKKAAETAKRQQEKEEREAREAGEREKEQEQKGQ